MERCPCCGRDVPVRTKLGGTLTVARTGKIKVTGDPVCEYVCFDCLVSWPPNQPDQVLPYGASTMAGVGLGNVGTLIRVWPHWG